MWMLVINLINLLPFFWAIPPLLARLLQVLLSVIITLPFQLKPYPISSFLPLVIIIFVFFIQANETIIIILIITFFTHFMVVIIKHE